jgi:hypothetical protein
MKVAYRMKSRMIQELQHCVEFQVIELMKMKTLKIEFESTVNWIQTTLMKGVYIVQNMTIQESQYSLER